MVPSVLHTMEAHVLVFSCFEVIQNVEVNYSRTLLFLLLSLKAFQKVNAVKSFHFSYDAN